MSRPTRPVSDQLLYALGSRYRDVVGYAATGNSGIYRAYDTVVRRVVNVCAPVSLGGGRFVNDFIPRAIRVGGRLHHPNVVPILDASVAGPMPFYTTPDADGRWLKVRLQRGPLPMAEVVKVVVGVATALDYCHRAGVIHRAIIPANVLVFDSHVTIQDFSIAIGPTPDDRVLGPGTPHNLQTYFTPEGLNDAPPAASEDLFALGCLAYECMTGRYPFLRATNLAIIAATLLEPVEGDFGDPVAARFFDLVVRPLLEKDPRDRFATALDVVEAARSFAEGSVDAHTNSGMLKPHRGDGAYAFCSYAREDFDRVEPLMSRIASSGLPVWWDRGIPGGAQWDDVIADRIDRSSGVVLFLTRSSAASKWVGREVAWADRRNKHTVAVQLEPVDLEGGFGMRLSGIQTVDATDLAGSDIITALGFVHEL